MLQISLNEWELLGNTSIPIDDRELTDPLEWIEPRIMPHYTPLAGG